MTTLADKLSTYTSNAELSKLLASDKFGLYSAKNYDATGDGATDDSAEILAMLSAASASTSKALFFPAGVYVVDNVTLTSTHFSGYNLYGDNASFSGITQDIQQIGTPTGDLSDLLTSATSSLVGAINELDANIGDLSDLVTATSSNLVGAINEVSAAGGSVLTTRGDILTRSSSGSVRLATGTPLQYIVAGNTSDAAPHNFKDSPQKVMTTAGDLLYANSPNSIARQAIGTTLQNLGVNATTDGYSFQDSPQKVLTATGDTLYASAANTIAKLAIGSSGEVLSVSTGLVPFWQSLGSLVGSPAIEVFTSNGTFTAPQAGDYKVTVVGGGGSSADNSGGGNAFLGGGGGGGMTIEIVTLTASQEVTVTVGAGGVDPNAFQSTGTTGSTSSFGAYCSATGGSGGLFSASNFGFGGSGGSGSGGDINLSGGDGQWSAQVAATNTAKGKYMTSHYEPYGRGGYATFGDTADLGEDGIVIVEWIGA